MQQATTQVDTAERFYMAFLSSESLYERAMAYINDSKAASIAERRALLIDVLISFTDESLQAQFLNYLDIMEVRPIVQKAVKGCVATIKKAAVPLINKLVSGMSEAELNDFGDYMNQIIVGVETNKGYVGYPVTPDIVANFETVFAGIRQGEGKAQIDCLQSTLVDMTRCAYFTFFEEPIKLIALGTVKRKLTDVALKVCKTTTLKLIETVFKGMPQKELEAVSNYLESMIYDSQSR